MSTPPPPQSHSSEFTAYTLPDQWGKLSLRFADSALERDYTRTANDANLPRTRWALWLALLITIAFIVLDRIALNAPPMMSQIRVWLVLPLVLATVALSYWLPSARCYPFTALVMIVLLCAFPVAMTQSSPDDMMFHVFGFMLTIMYINIALYLPLAAAALISAISVAVMSSAVVSMPVSSPTAGNFVSLLIAGSLMTLYVVWARVRAQRGLFLAARNRQRLLREWNERQAKQVTWLKQLPIHLQSDLQNRLFSLEEDLETLLGRANRGDAPLLRQSLARVAKLTDIFEAVRYAADFTPERQPDRAICLTDMVNDIVLQRARDMTDDHSIALKLESEVWIHGDPTLLREAIEMLLSSSSLGAERDTWINVRLQQRDQELLLSVSVPAPLPAVAVGPGSATDSQVRFGLGLSIAARIFELHQGHLSVDFDDGRTIVKAALPRISTHGDDNRKPLSVAPQTPSDQS